MFGRTQTLWTFEQTQSNAVLRNLALEFQKQLQIILDTEPVTVGDFTPFEIWSNFLISMQSYKQNSGLIEAFLYFFRGVAPHCVTITNKK